MMELKDILLNCDGYNFVDDKAYADRTLTLEELLDLTENLYMEVERLMEKIEDIEQDIEDNYRKIPLDEQYGLNNNDFI